MKKVLAAIRRNGVEVATLFDQNHIDNHKNSMAGQTVLIELAQGDRVQVDYANYLMPILSSTHSRYIYTPSLGCTTNLGII